MKTDVVDHLQRQWMACDKEKQALLRENERLKAELTEVQRKQKIALDNAYADGYEAGKQDAMK